MGKYVDGFVLVVPKDKVAEYKKMAKEGAESWMKFGALQYFECMGEDLVTKDMGGMKALEFTELTKAKPTDTVWFSFIVFKSRKHRDEVNKKVIDAMNEAMKDQKDFQMPFDMKRMAYGGFEAVVEA
jgi:uncharacterized protein YbaA (DUF1428 family)